MAPYMAGGGLAPNLFIVFRASISTINMKGDSGDSSGPVQFEQKLFIHNNWPAAFTLELFQLEVP